jgi:hypothetical protein
LDQARAKYGLVTADQDNHPGSVDVIAAVTETLWFGHRDRHEGGPTSAPITPESAEAALSIATTLVHRISTGSIRKKSLRDRRPEDRTRRGLATGIGGRGARRATPRYGVSQAAFCV